jgi:hypothetical protein
MALFVRFEFSTICRYTQWIARILNADNIFRVTEHGICGVTVRQNEFSHVHRLRKWTVQSCPSNYGFLFLTRYGASARTLRVVVARLLKMLLGLVNSPFLCRNFLFAPAIGIFMSRFSIAVAFSFHLCERQWSDLFMVFILLWLVLVMMFLFLFLSFLYIEFMIAQNVICLDNGSRILIVPKWLLRV